MVDAVALRNCTVGAEGVDIIIRRAGSKLRIKDTGSNELKLRGNNETHGASRNLEATLIRVLANINDSLLKRGLIKIGSRRGSVAVRRSANNRMASINAVADSTKQRNTITGIVSVREPVV